MVVTSNERSHRRHGCTRSRRRTGSTTLQDHRIRPLVENRFMRTRSAPKVNLVRCPKIRNPVNDPSAGILREPSGVNLIHHPGIDNESNDRRPNGTTNDGTAGTGVLFDADQNGGIVDGVVVSNSNGTSSGDNDTPIDLNADPEGVSEKFGNGHRSNGTNRKRNAQKSRRQRSNQFRSWTCPRFNRFHLCTCLQIGGGC
jgi:hypothetical protein